MNFFSDQSGLLAIRDFDEECLLKQADTRREFLGITNGTVYGEQVNLPARTDVHEIMARLPIDRRRHQLDTYYTRIASIHPRESGFWQPDSCVGPKSILVGVDDWLNSIESSRRPSAPND